MNRDGNSTWLRRANNYISAAELYELGGRPFDPKTIAFPKVGATIYTNKKRILASASVVDNNVMGVTITDDELCSPEFLFFWFQHIELATLSSPGTVPSITSARVKSQKLMLPPREEQDRIAMLLWAVQRAVERQERLVALNAELKKALMHKLFTEGTRGEPLVQTKIGMVPESWTVVELQQHSEPPQYGFTASAGATGNAQILRITDIQESGVDWASVPRCECPNDDLEKCRLLSEDLVFARIGATTGKNFLVFNPPQDAVFASYLIRVRTRPSLSSRFLAFYCQTASYWGQIAANKGNNLKGGFNSSLLRRMLVSIPSGMSEQEKIADVLEALDQKAHVARRIAGALNSLFRTLLYELMTAQVSVHELDLSALDESAAEPVGVA